MVNEKENYELVETLIENTEAAKKVSLEKFEKYYAKKKKAIFKRLKIKDIVFLAIMSCSMLLTGAIMPLVTQVPVFGIIQLCLGLQFSIFPVIGMLKVRKIGSLTLMSIFSGIVLVFMFPPMFFCLLICALISELITIIIFRGYKKNIASIVAGSLYMPLTTPFLYIWYNVIYTVNTAEDGQAVQAYVFSEPYMIVIMTFAILALCIVGSIIGYLISKELYKAGVFKNE